MYEYSARVLRVIDGDTISLDVDLGMNVHVKERCRLLGVNTPETYGVKKDSVEYKAGMSAKVWLMEEIGEVFDCSGTVVEPAEHPVRIRTHKDKKGKYGRYLAEVFVGDDTESINTKLIHMGFGAEY